jgi:hypothetical protein
VTTPTNSPSLPPSLLAREQAAQVATDEANARKAAADADTSALTLAQTKYKSLVPDLTGVATNAVDDKSTGVAFSGLVTYSALNHAAEIIANRISNVLSDPAEGQLVTILVTSQSDLLTNDLLSSTVASSLQQLIDFADEVLAEPKKPRAVAPHWRITGVDLEMLTRASTAALTGGVGIAAGAAGAAAAAGLGPIGLGAAAAAAVPSIISLFSSTTTVKDHAEDITDLATTTSVVGAVSEKLDGYTVVHEDFRLAPEESQIRETYRQLVEKRTALVFKQEEVQTAKNQADLELSRAQQKQDAAKKAQPPPSDDDAAALADQVAEVEAASGNAAAALSLISSAITSIDAFTTAVNATAAGTRSPLAIASLNELLHQDGGDRIGYVLSVKGLGGQSEEYTKDRHVGFDTYTTLADASVAFMLFDVAARKIVRSGIANGVSSVHGQLGKPPTGLVGPNAEDAIGDQGTDIPPTEDQPAGQHQPWWRRIF